MYSLEGVNSNAYGIMGYTQKALKKSGLSGKVDSYLEEAQSGDYNDLIQVSLRYIEEYNEAEE